MSVNKLVYVAPLKWSSYSQRPHYMMRFLADNTTVKILWIDPFPVRLPKYSDIFRRRDVYNQSTKKYPGIEVLSHRSVPVEPLVNCNKLYQRLFLRTCIERIEHFIGGNKAVLGIGKPCCLAKTLLDAGHFCRSFYDAMDDYPEFHTGISKKYVASIENQLASRVDEVFVSSHYLKDKFTSANQCVRLIPNGYDGDNVKFVGGSKTVNTPDTKMITIGYVGTIYHWFDWDLVVSIAMIVPGVTIKLIGPVLGEIPGNLPANIVLLPPCPNDEAMAHMKSFSIGLIPFLKNNATRAVDPIKYYEYRALNLPVLSTLFGDMQYKIDDPGLFIVPDNSNGQLSSLIESALSYRVQSDDFVLRSEAMWTSRFKSADILSDYLGLA